MAERNRWRTTLLWIAVAGAATLFLVLSGGPTRVRRVDAPSDVDPPRPGERSAPSREAPPRSHAPDAEIAPTQPGNPARLHGLVSGRYGGIWGVRVLALAPGSDRILAETGTGTDGRYALDLDAPVRLDLRIAPSPITGLETITHEGVFLEPGESRQIDFPLESGYRLEGQVRFLGATGYPFGKRMRVFAVPAEVLGSDATRGDLHPARLRGSSREGAHLREEGRFELTGLTPGEWRLMLDSDRWMFVVPPIVNAESGDCRLEAVPACSFFAIAVDFADEARLPGVRARVEIDERPITPDLTGDRGVLVYRAPAKGARMSEAELVVEAPGYRTRRLRFPIPTAHRIRMLPEVEADVTLLLRFPDGEPYTGPLAATLDREFELELHGDGSGRFRVAVPVCPFRLTLEIPKSPLDSSARLALPDKRPIEIGVPVERGGSLSVTLLRGGEVFQPHLLVERQRDRVGDDSKLLARGSSAGFDLDPGRELRLDPLPPGRYTIRITDWYHHAWTTTVEVRAGECASVVAPRLQRKE